MDTTTDENFFQITLINLFFSALDVFIHLVAGLASVLLSTIFNAIIPA